MIAGEREIGERRIALKELSLVTPELAKDLGLASESPVFVSPIVNSDRGCPYCFVTYGPLIYASGALVEAHHFHPWQRGTGEPPREDGGIYIFGLGRFQMENPSWIAEVELRGRLGSDSVERVFVKGIRAYCRPKCCGNELESGFVVMGATVGKGFLVPSCGSLRSLSRRERVRYNFKIVEGNVLFSEL